MKDNRPVLCVDMDDVLEDFSPHWHLALDRMYGTSYVHRSPTGGLISDMHTWLSDDNVRDYYPKAKSFAETLEPLADPEFWKTVPAIPGALGTMSWADKYFRIISVTVTPSFSWDPKLRHCIFPQFPMLNEKNCYCVARKQDVKCDIIVDDHAENLYGHSAPLKLYYQNSMNHHVEKIGPSWIKVYDWENINFALRRVLDSGEV